MEVDVDLTLADACVTFDTEIQETQSPVSRINVYPKDTRWGQFLAWIN